MRTKVKICGLTNLADARFCAGAGADLLGFIQYDQSPRYVAPAQAKEIIAWVYGPETVGVFVNASAEVVNAAVAEVGFGKVQLHGDEPPAVCAAIEAPVIKALRVAADTTADALRRQLDPYAPHVEAFLLDTHRAGVFGGTGAVFDWDVARSLLTDYPIFLAGGISPENVADALALQPYGVDLSSSLEARPGVKDYDRVMAFFDAYQTATEAS